MPISAELHTGRRALCSPIPQTVTVTIDARPSNGMLHPPLVDLAIAAVMAVAAVMHASLMVLLCCGRHLRVARNAAKLSSEWDKRRKPRPVLRPPMVPLPSIVRFVLAFKTSC